MTDYGQGYADGKRKAHDELRWWYPGGHAGGCECDVCITARSLVRSVMDTLEVEKSAPSSDTPRRQGAA